MNSVQNNDVVDVACFSIGGADIGVFATMVVYDYETMNRKYLHGFWCIVHSMEDPQPDKT